MFKTINKAYIQHLLRSSTFALDLKSYIADELLQDQELEIRSKLTNIFQRFQNILKTQGLNREEFLE